MKKKILVCLLSALAVTSVGALSACGVGEKPAPEEPPAHKHVYSTQWSNDGENHWHEPTCGDTEEVKDKDTHNFNSNNTCDVCGYRRSISLENFIKDYTGKAKAFVSEYIRPEVVGASEVLAEKWSVSANENDQFVSVSFAFTYKDSDTERTIQIVNATLEKPVDLYDIAHEKATFSGNSVSASTATVFSFDAKENSEKQNLASALYATHGDTCDVMLFTEIEPSRGTRKAYDILVVNNNQYLVKTLEVLRGDGKDETIIANLNDETTRTGLKIKNTYTLNGTNIYTKEYELESFGASTENLPQT